MLTDSFGRNEPLEAIMDLVAQINRRNATLLFLVVVSFILPVNALAYFEESIPIGILDIFRGHTLVMAITAGLLGAFVTLLCISLTVPLNEPEWEEMLEITKRYPGVVFYLEEMDHPEVRHFLCYLYSREGLGYVA